jgi:hypothetical protein
VTVSLTTIAPAEPLGAPAAARTRVLDSAIIGCYLLVAFGLYRDLWLHLGTGYLVDSSEDQNLFEWFFAVQAQGLAHGQLTLFSTLQNHPLGVNLMGNTAMPGLALPLAPLTWLFGPTLTWVTILTGGLAGTATGWYLLFSRCLVPSRLAAGVGAGFCAFAPPVVSHAVAHPNFTAMFLLPPIVWLLLRLSRAATVRPVRDGLLLGLLVSWQVLIGEEPLLILATGLAVFVLAWAVLRPREWAASARAALPGLVLAVLTAVVLVGYPLWVQFAGPGSYRALEHGPAGNDLGTFGALPRQSLGGRVLHPGQLVDNPTEQNAFFGWPLLALLLVGMVWLRGRLVARLASVTALVTLALSLGPHLFLHAHDTGIPGPWLLVGKLPLFDSLIEARMSFAALPAIGMLLALGTDTALRGPAGRPLGPPALRGLVTARRLWFAGLVLALLPILPVRYTVQPRPPVAAFFTDGAWRAYTRPGRTLVTVPPPEVGAAQALHWQVLAGLGFALPEGYFVGPTSPIDKSGMYGAVPRLTSALFTAIEQTGALPVITEAQRAQAVADLRFWQADAVVLPFDTPNAVALRAALDQLFGPGQARDGVLVWPVRALTG